jgi:ferredoxin-NADP reductase
MGAAATSRRPRARRRLLDAATWLTTPLLPDDYLSFVNPLWSSRELRGRVVAVIPETADSASVVLRPGRDWLGHEAGQYVRLSVEIDGVRHHRSYSLTSRPGASDGCIAVTVKAVAGGSVSAQLVHHTEPGTIVGLEQAAGSFRLGDRIPDRLLFITAGSGITPVMGMLRALAGGLPDVVLIHIERTREEVIFGAELRRLAFSGELRLHEWHTDLHGRPTPAALANLAGDWLRRETFACGPGELLDGLESHFAAARASDRLCVERFRTPLGVAGAGGRVTFVRSGRAVDAGGSTPLLQAGESAGALLPSGCRMGNCHTCVGRLRSGRVCDLRTGEVHGTPGDMIQTCVSAAAGPVEILL